MSVLAGLDGVSKSHDARPLLSSVSLGVVAGDRIGVVGRNGSGKTTLLRLVAGGEPPDHGRVTRSAGLRVGFVGQSDELDPAATVRAVVAGDAAEHEWRGEPVTRQVLAGLAVEPLLDRRIGSLSGGERRRVALAGVLVRDLDLLLLDEPTNHLDVEGVAWLAGHLISGQARHAGLVVVTHDRWFLDEVCTQTWEVADGAVHRYAGGYAAYTLARAERMRLAATRESRRLALVRKELVYLRRGAPARTSKPRYRVEAAEALIADEPPARDQQALRRFATARLGRTVVELEDVSLAFGGRDLLRRVTWRLAPAERVGVIGVNGAGKTTLLRVLLGEQAPDSGRVVTGPTVRPASLSQHIEELPGQLQVLAAVEQVARVVDVGGKQWTAAQLAERFGFPPARQRARVGDLSGGERRRLQLLRLLMTGPNLLVLDEPTNDLDVDTLVQLEDVLDDWPGTLVVVSHDRWFLERVTDGVVALLGDGSLAALPGGVEEYLARRAAAREPGEVTPGQAGLPARAVGDTRAARRELARLERQLARLAERERTLHAQLAAAAADWGRAAELDVELAAVAAERTAVEDAWLATAEEASG